jgi:hypothetical protein
MEPRYLLDRRLDGLQSRPGYFVEKNSALSGIEPYPSGPYASACLHDPSSTLMLGIPTRLKHTKGNICCVSRSPVSYRVTTSTTSTTSLSKATESLSQFSHRVGFKLTTVQWQTSRGEERVRKTNPVTLQSKGKDDEVRINDFLSSPRASKRCKI